MSLLTWMTITDTQVTVTATTLSPRTLASISRHPVWYRASVSGEELGKEVELPLTSQDTGTVCSASSLRINNENDFWSFHIFAHTPVCQGDSPAAVEGGLGVVPGRPQHGVVDTLAVVAVAPARVLDVGIMIS